MTGHYYLQIDPDELRFVAKRLDGMHDHLHAKGVKASACPGDIGDDWQGAAATAIKAEMSGLGGQMTGFSSQFHTSSAAIKSLAKDYEDALDQVDVLNKKWDAADTTYTGAVKAANDTYTDATNDNNKLKGPIRKVAQTDAQDSRNFAQGAAYDAQQKTHGILDNELALIKNWLRGQTAAAGTSLSDAAPSKVTDQQINDWKNGKYPTRLSHPGLLAAMATTAAREKAQAAAAANAAYEAAKKQAAGDVAALDKLLENPYADPSDINAALATIGTHKQDPVYAKALLDDLGPDGLNDLYDKVGRELRTYNDVTTTWPGMKAFDDTVALGLAQSSDKDLAAFSHDFMHSAHGAKRWALISASTNADGRTEAIALAYSNRIWAPDENSSGLDPYSAMFNLAYGKEKVLDHLADHSTGADLAKVLSASSDGDRSDLLMEMMNTVGANGYQMSQADFARKAALFDGALKVLVAGGRQNSAAVQAMLSVIGRADYPYSDALKPGVKAALDDPRAIAWIVQEIRYGQFDAGTLTDAFKSVDIDVDDLVARTIDYEIDAGYDPSRLATDVGYLLGTDDLLGATISPEGVLKSLAGSVAGLNPVTGAAYGVFSALMDELEAQQQNEQDWSDGWKNEKAERLLSFLIYSKAHNGTVPGFEDWLVKNHREKDPDAIIAFYEDQENQGTPTFKDLDTLRTDIDEARDES